MQTRTRGGGLAELLVTVDVTRGAGVINGLFSLGMAIFPLTVVAVGMLMLLTVLMATGWDRMVLTLVTRPYSITGDNGGD